MKNLRNRYTKSITFALLLNFGILSTPASAIARSQPKLYKVTIGTWGARGAEIVTEKTSVKLRFDCADGEIPRALRTDKRGKFKVEGTYTKRGFGPIRINKPLAIEPATYEGRVTGKSMKIKITVIATGDLVGEFTLIRGREARIRGCR